MNTFSSYMNTHTHMYMTQPCLIRSLTRRNLGSMPLSRFIPFCCAHRNRTSREPLEPRVEQAREQLIAENTESEFSDTTTVPAPIEKILWVVPTGRGGYFGKEGLEPCPTWSGDVRWYAVWDIPGVGRWRVAGLHWGHGTIAYAAILRLHSGEFKGIAFRRCDSREEAERLFLEEAGQYDVLPEGSARVIGWSFTHDLEARE